MSFFGGDGRAYLKFVYEGTDKEFNFPITQGLYLGSREFIDEIRSRITKKAIKDRQISDIPFDKIKEGVCRYFEMKPHELLKIRRRQPAIQQSRKVLIYLARQYTPMTLSEIGQKLGGVSPQLVNNAFRQVNSDKNMRNLALGILNQM